jgi:molybdate transport system substrate-binding protein
MMRTLHLLSAGAAQGLVKALQADFEREQGCRLQGRFGAVGAMKEALLAGEPCDLMVLSDALVDGLVAEGRLRGDARAALGRVRTGVAVPAGRPHPDVSTPEALRTALLAAEAVYFPDPQRATAGIHFTRVLQTLGVHETLAERLRTFPNGATAMAEMARSGLPGAIGCTQVTEILYTPGVELVAMLPPQFELATVYTTALTTDAREPELAAQLLATLAAPQHRALRESGGFEA